MPHTPFIIALWQGKCPQCREGKVFSFPIRSITRFGKMNAQCPVCAASFEHEPGFYFGAMFISYAINVAVFVATWITLYLLWNPSDGVYVLAIALMGLLCTPFTFRSARVLWLYWFGGLSYRPDRMS